MYELKQFLLKIRRLQEKKFTTRFLRFVPDQAVINLVAMFIPEKSSDKFIWLLNVLQKAANEQQLTILQLLTCDDAKDFLDSLIDLVPENQIRKFDMEDPENGQNLP